MKKIYMTHSKGQKNYELFIGDYNRDDFKANGYIIDFTLKSKDFEKIFGGNVDRVYETFGDCNCNASLFNFTLKLRG